MNLLYFLKILKIRTISFVKFLTMRRPAVRMKSEYFDNLTAVKIVRQFRKLGRGSISGKFRIVRQFRHRGCNKILLKSKFEISNKILLKSKFKTKYYWNQKSILATKSKFEKTKKLSYNKIKRKGFQKLKNLKLSP